jgi:hypothetical protein
MTFFWQYLYARAVWQARGVIGFVIAALIVGFMLTPKPTPEQLAERSMTRSPN